METKVEILEGNRAKVTVTIDEKTVSNAIKKEYKKAATQYNIPGFRRGKAPRPVIDNALGKEYISAVVTDTLINDTYPEAIDEANLYPVGQPEFAEDDMELATDGKPFTFEFTIETKPTLALSSYDPITIELPPAEVTDEQVDEEMNHLLEHYYEIVNAPANTKVKAENFVDMKVTATDDNGNDIESITADSTQYGLGSGLYPETFDEELLGLKKGDTKQFTIDVPTEPYAMTATLAGKTSKINFDVEILAVQKKKLPELTDEWVKEKIGVDTIDDLRNELREEIQAQIDSLLPRLKEARVLAELQDRLEGELPEGVVDDEESTLLQDFFSQLQRQGITLDAYLKQQGISSDQFREDVRKQAEDVAKQDMALDAYAAHEGIEATDEDILAEFEKSGAKNPKRLMEDWRKNGQMHLVRQGILRQKAAQQIMDTAVVKEEKADKKSK